MVAQPIEAMTARRGAAYWRGLLQQAPDWALEEEAARRREEATETAAIAIGGLVVDPVASTVLWRGERYVLSGRRMEVVYALAVAWMQGRTRLRPDSLARMIWRGWETEAALCCLRSTVHDVRRLVPDLIVSGAGPGRGYHFAVPADLVGRRVEVAA